MGILPFALSSIAFAIYILLNRHHGLGFFDASEYSTHVQDTGIAHAPGYPLYTMLSKLANFAVNDPFTAQFAVSFVSALVAALFLVLAFREARNYDPRAAALTVLLFFSSYFVKLYTLLPEVFLLNLAIHAAMAWAMQRWYQTLSSRRLFVVFLIYGLGFCHHHTLAFTLPALACLAWFKRSKIDWPRSTIMALLGGLVGILPLAYLFYASTPEPTHSYYHVNNFADLLFVVLRKGYGTFSLTVFQQSSTKAELFALVLTNFARNFGYVGLLVLVPFGFGLRSTFKDRVWLRKLREEPLMVFSLLSLAIFFCFFVPKNNIPLTFAKYRHIVLRFLTIPTLLFMYPAYYGFRRALARWSSPAFLWGVAGVILAINVPVDREMRFAHYDTLDKHIAMGFQTILSQVDPKPVSEINPRYQRCAIFVRPDALVFGVRYYNQFVSERSCFFFTLASFTGQFRAKNEEVLQQRVFGAEYPQLIQQYSTNAPALMTMFFLRLKQLGFRIFLFYATDATVFINTPFSYRPIGNLQELVSPNDPPFPMITLLDQERRYLKEMDTYLDSLAQVTLPHILLDESVSGGVFQNVNEYHRLTGPVLRADPALEALEARIQIKMRDVFN